MSWTEDMIVAEFRKHVIYWQAKLRLQDIKINIRLSNDFSPADGSDDWWCKVRMASGGANPYAADYLIRRGNYYNQTQFDVWSTAAHELVHIMNWAMAHSFDALEDHFAASQLNMAKVLMRRGNEQLAYKWEEILVEWFKDDAPPNTIPDDPVAERTEA